MKIIRCSGVYEPEDDSYLMLSVPEIKGKILDLGSGTGIIGIHYLEKGNDVIFSDISEEAAKCTKLNLKANGFHADVIISDLFNAIKGKFDFCLFNPPYLPSDDANDLKWTGGIVGNEIIHRYIEEGKKFCKIMYFIESSLAPANLDKYKNLSFKIVSKITYHLEEIRLVRVEECQR